VVVRWSQSRKQYERKGILVEPDAIEGAEQECLSDAEVHASRRERDGLRRADEDVRFQADLAAAPRTISGLLRQPGRGDRAVTRRPAAAGGSDEVRQGEHSIRMP
jgi:hypothetical protein